jgi:hypothetical protein
MEALELTHDETWGADAEVTPEHLTLCSVLTYHVYCRISKSEITPDSVLTYPSDVKLQSDHSSFSLGIIN